ncbi:UDP-N-acetylmuramate dehydrogenase [Candidatus Margulisiibacteriota bacterium]
MQKNISEIYRKLKKIKDIRIFKGEALSKHTTLKVGGTADLLVVPKSIEALKEVLKASDRLPIKIIGNGSNILVSDRGVRGIILKLAGGLCDIEFDGNKARVGVGVLVPRLLAKAHEAGLSGLEFAAGIPGTVGGAVLTNMGAFGRAISKLVREITLIDRKGKEIVLKGKELKFKYRKGPVLRGKSMIVSVVLGLRKARKILIKKRIEKYLAAKKKKQPLSVPSAGCVFRNPKGRYAGKLIEDAGCKGFRVGGAEVSKTHANYIINLGDATCSDVTQLANKIKKKVKERAGVSLKYEIIDSNHLNMLS